MSREELQDINNNLISYFEKTGIKNACYYEPIDSTIYWNETKKIAFCNLEPYNMNDVKNKIVGYKLLDESLFFDHWFYSKTSGTTVFINYLLRTCMYEKKEMTVQYAKNIKQQIKNEGNNGYYKLCDEFKKSLYFNFWYVQYGKRKTVNTLLYGKYKDDFYKKHYRDFIKASEIDILVVSGIAGATLIQIIYPELKGKFKYCGEPIKYEGITFVSMPHPAVFKYESIVNTVNKIFKVLNN